MSDAASPGNPPGGGDRQGKPAPQGLRVLHFPARQPSRLRRWLVWSALLAAGVAVFFVSAILYALHNAGPILRERVIATLEQRFRSPVELDSLNVAYEHGIQVSGGGLRILNFGRNAAASAADAGQQPMLSVDSFDFHTSARQILKPVVHVDVVHVRGMRLDIPPRGSRGPMMNPHLKPGKAGLVVDKIVCTDLTLGIETDKPGKLPLLFVVHDLTLRDVGAGRPFLFDARLVNPKPIGEIHSTGQFGPWNEQAPRDSPVEGDYSFTDADLGPIPGVAGILSSTGKYKGTLGQIGVTGSTDTPNFSLDVSGQPVDLRTQFDALVDGTSGDTRLNHVHATLLNTVLDVSGMVIQADHRRAPEFAAELARDPIAAAQVRGHLIDLHVVTNHARIEDILTLGVKTQPAIMRGALALQAHLTIPPGKQTVSKKMAIQGHFAVRGATFSNPKWQETLDRMSVRAEGHPKEVSSSDLARVPSQMAGNFSLGHGSLSIPDLTYEIPGVRVSLGGTYGLDGKKFDFAGNVQTDATASAMLTGWKHWVVKPFDPLFKKNGAGLEVPVTISGTRSDIKFGVDKAKLGHQIFSRHKDSKEHTSVPMKDDRIAGDPRPIRPIAEERTGMGSGDHGDQ